MLRYLPLALWLVLVVYSSVDIAQSDDNEVRGMRRLWWVVLVYALPFVGAIAWLVAGRPRRNRAVDEGNSDTPRRLPPAPLGPDDDPAFMNRLKREKWLREADRDAADAEPEPEVDPGSENKDEPGTSGSPAA